MLYPKHKKHTQKIVSGMGRLQKYILVSSFAYVKKQNKKTSTVCCTLNTKHIHTKDGIWHGETAKVNRPIFHFHVLLMLKKHTHTGIANYIFFFKLVVCTECVGLFYYWVPVAISTFRPPCSDLKCKRDEVCTNCSWYTIKLLHSNSKLIFQ